ncbi:MAG TPA: transposase [Planctomycetota bacterium]|nr:transposase [Planctomycetota bacterium]
MPRGAREREDGRFHHVYARGNRRQTVFGDDDDRRWFLRRLKGLEAESGAIHLAHCLMPNHFHLVVRPGPDGLSKLLHRLLGSYARWFNTRHGQVGHLFQDRFGSRPIRDDLDLVWLVRYVHRNPVEAGLVIRPGDWRWSSHRDLVRAVPPPYIREGARLLRRAFALEESEAIARFRRSVEIPARSPDEIGALLRLEDGLAGASAPVASEDPGQSENRALRELAAEVARRYRLRSQDSIVSPSRDPRIVVARVTFCREALNSGRATVRDVARHLERSAATVWRLAARKRR